MLVSLKCRSSFSFRAKSEARSAEDFRLKQGDWKI